MPPFQDEGAQEIRVGRAVRIDTPIGIDGVLDEPEWQLAESLGELHQLEPVEGVPPSEPTEIRILYDRDHLYIGVWLFDSDPAALITTSRTRDARLEVDDRIELVIDTFLDRRNAFFFQINPTGSKGDALITGNGADFNKPWDGIWEGKASVDERGWYAELAIPFKTLSFATDLDTWGFNLMRFIGRRRETARWNNGSRNVGLFAISEAGQVTGLEGMRQGIGLDLVPFYATSLEKDHTGGGDGDVFGEPGIDAFYKLRADLTLSLTVNTDFAETEVDQRQINLTRFPLFFPERRDFFLQDAGNFTFGDGGPIPFFSRRIGLVQGEEVPLLAGAKLTGRVGDWGLGILDVQTDEADIEDLGTIDGKNLFAGRVTRNVGQQSRIGGIVTNGNPAGAEDNTVVGVDAQYRTTDFGDGETLTSSVFLLNADSEQLSGEESAFGARVSYPNDVWRWNMRFEEVQENFEPALGFVSRSDIRRYVGEFDYRPRIGGDIRQLEFSVDAQVITDTDDVFESSYGAIQPFGVQFESGDSLRVNIVNQRDELREDFEISDGVVIPEGDYDFTRFRLNLDSAEKRPVSLSGGYMLGDFYEGTREDIWFTLTMRSDPLLISSLSFENHDIDLPGGAFTTQVASARTDFSFSQSLSWSSIVQWDNVSETIGLNSRLRWIPDPGHEVFIVFNETLDENRDSLSPLFQELAFKVSYTWRL